MVSPHSKSISQNGIAPRCDAILRGLLPQLTHLVVSQLDAFSARLSNALLALSEQSMDAREANLSFSAGQLLKKNGYAFYYLASSAFDAAFRHELHVLLRGDQESKRNTDPDVALSLVSYEEMDKKLAFSNVSRTLELDSAAQYTALNMRLAHLLQLDALSIAQNPFRPEVFLNTIYASWCQFDTEQESHELILPLLRPDILFDLEPILAAVNEALIEKGVLPDLHESYRIQRKPRSDSNASVAESERSIGAQDLTQKLKTYLSGGASMHATQHPSSNQSRFAMSSDGGDGGGSYAASAESSGEQTGAPAQTALFQHLTELQQSPRFNQLMADAQDVLRLSQLRQQMPELASTGVEKQTLDLLSQVFDSVFRNQAIPGPIKELIAVLQIPVLKAALLDSEFFFQEQHPARRLIELLSRYSLAWDQKKGQDDPLYQTMQRNVQRVQQEFQQQISLFDEVVTDLENFIKKEEDASAEALAAPINTALKKEKIKQANIAASNQVALRVGTGEVVAFVETFLENRWTKVLTLAYSVKEEKPHAVDDAINTMDDLIWSVKPKVSLQQRQELLNRLPAILARLNKWLSLIKWEDADRIQFFAELAECHASIVRAPLDLSPERQLEIAMEVAQQAAERRLAKKAEQESQQAEHPPAPVDEFVDTVANLERGIWLEFTKKNGTTNRMRLAWVSPMRSLYIFTSSQKEKSFSVSAEELELTFREKRARVLVLDKVIDRALMDALNTSPALALAESTL
ncbi:DUF1631 family protein [Undibacterium sp. SXout7W]|uniref:DUF1631 family protein n=1 Tax=Undibacterium sp. SXout7W TaxID=3413049 RepID=UPI003BF096E5